MPDYSHVPQLRVYPMLWDRSVSRHPHDWRAQLRSLCALARMYKRDHHRDYTKLPLGEKRFLQALATVDITTLQHEYPTEDNPLLRIDPHDPHVDKEQYAGLYPPQLNGKRYGHA